MDVNLVLQAKNGSNKVFPLPSSVTVIGRRRNCDLRIPLESISRRHCQFSLEDSELKLRDLGSRNGTYLNGKQVEEQVVQPGDRIQVGPLVFLLQIDGKPKFETNSMSDKPSPTTDPIDNLDQLDEAGSDLDLDLEDSEGLDDLDLEDLEDL